MPERPERLRSTAWAVSVSPGHTCPTNRTPNDVSRHGIGFDADDNEVTFFDRWGGTDTLPRMSKEAVADAILSRVLTLRATTATGVRR